MKYPQLVSMPSAVSDWLEEQLEARGIDAVVYTRYVLSLLYRDPIDVICPDQDLHFTQPEKEVRRSGGGRKRLRRSSGWWGHDLADADRLKRSAAVECLMSASDQKCGIESLVDELCEKLKEINSNQSTNGKELLPEKKRAVSPQDPAKRYYAAFPPLSRNSSVNSPNLINLIPKWFGSPKKRTPRKQNRSSSYEEKLHCKVELDNMKSRSVGKQRYNYFSRNKKEFGYCRNVNKSMDKTENANNWDQLYLFNNNAKNKCSNTSWSQPKDIINFVNDKNKETTENLGSWKTLDDSLNMYDDLPVDIRELLNSPNPQEDDTVEMMNLANMRDTGNKTFIQCGTNIISSIWSNDAAMDDANRIYENSFNTALDENSSESFLDLKFSSISIDSKNKWPTCDIIAENETNSYFENFNKSLLDSSFSSWNIGSNEKFQKWSDAENEVQTNDIMRSLSILNHSKESSFTEVIPRPGKAGLNIFGTNNVVKLMQEAALKKLESEKDEDLLHSIHSHFKPINEKTEMRSNGQYADGTTFIIPSNVDNITYKRSDSGFLYLETEQGMNRKYMDFRRSEEGDFSLKFNICQNDKASQTDSDLLEISNCSKEQESFYFPGDQELLIDDSEECECADKTAETLEIYGEDNVLTEIFSKYENKCDQCNNNSSWESYLFRKDLDKKLDKQSIRDIWSGGEVCTACMNLNNTHSSLSVLQSKLREDISQDGEQLLSDLSSIQKTYMEELPVAEVSCNISELLGIKERKRRHSSINYEGAISVQEDCFSFATRLEEDCLMNIATIPTLRSVTL
ncbi:hypothetical protein AMK59_657 [Oryctes borbonicus]|uniref:Uncharacterized protein n=1 Tax=Oryctes borbonicus TaxID=1629725 RepID=A0A0T6BB05_9SCAR|nr:hypothetical protein AMK59_657 [Oryctes borbonicus]